MEEHFFFVQPKDIIGNKFSLTEPESVHFKRSLRGKPGDIIWLLDGQGLAHKGEVTFIERTIGGDIIQSISNYGESIHSIHLVMGMIKGSRMDMVLEKATELGVKSIQPILADRSIKNKLNIERARRIVISAAKQAGRSLFPIIYKPISLNEWLRHHKSQKIISAHINGKNSLIDGLGNKQNEVYVIVGPEGDFSTSEIEIMENANVFMVSLGPRRLRSESAAIAIIANLNQIMEK